MQRPLSLELLKKEGKATREKGKERAKDRQALGQWGLFGAERLRLSRRGWKSLKENLLLLPKLLPPPPNLRQM
jgi:hypothetical protein